MNKRQKNIFIYAFRYSLDRYTGAIDDVMDEWNNTKDFFEKWEYKLMINEINDKIKNIDYFHGFSDHKDIRITKLTQFRNNLKKDLEELVNGETGNL